MNLEPLQDGQTAVVIGGGPGGAACAIALKKLACETGRQVNVLLFDGKASVGETHYNQCVGVLSPPIEQVMARIGIPFPHHLVQRKIRAYVLHGETRQIRLTEAGEVSYATRRVEFDAYMLNQAREQGVEVRPSRVTDLEFLPDRVNVYAEGSRCEAAVVFGAFGLDPGASAMLAQATPYRPPRFLVSMVTKIHPPPGLLEPFGEAIYAFLPRNPRIEFGAITPKGNHVTVNLAGARVDSRDMDAFLAYPPVRRRLYFADPQNPVNPARDFIYYRGRFPISLARHFYGDRYVCVGDAAGLVRAFKGKGVTSAIQTAIWAAETAMHHGISRQAFHRHYRTACHGIIRDIPYGQAMRRLAILGSRLGLVDLLIALAEENAILRRALFDAVSAHRDYRLIVADLLAPGELARLGLSLVRLGFRQNRPLKTGQTG